MTLTSFETPAGAQEFVLRDEQGPIQLLGEIVADISWSYEEALERGFFRWTDITLYRNLDSQSSVRYAIQVIGRSLVYHRRNSRCHKGIAVTVNHLRQDEKRYPHLAVCPVCDPLDLEDMNGNDVVNSEEDIYTLHKCRDAAAVVDTMKSRGNRGSASPLNLKLLQAAERGDADIAAALVRTRRL